MSAPLEAIERAVSDARERGAGWVVVVDHGATRPDEEVSVLRAWSIAPPWRAAAMRTVLAAGSQGVALLFIRTDGSAAGSVVLLGAAS